MNAQEIIEYIRTAPKKTPVKVYVWEDTPVDFPNCQVFPAAPGHKIVFGDWADVAPVLEQNHFRHLEIENNCHNSAIPLLDIKNIPARIEPGAIIPGAGGDWKERRDYDGRDSEHRRRSGRGHHD